MPSGRIVFDFGPLFLHRRRVILFLEHFHRAIKKGGAMKYAMLFAGCAAILLLAGCGGKSTEEESAEAMAERMIENAARQSGQDVDVDISSGRMTIRGTDEEGGAVNVNVDGESATVTTEDGSSTVAVGAAAKIPDDFPKDVPLYKGMEVMAVQKDAASGATGFTATSKDGTAKVAEFYKKQAAAEGWTQDADMPQGPMHMLAFSKGDRKLNVVLMGDGNATNIQLTVGKE
jgi:hypothetical protein